MAKNLMYCSWKTTTNREGEDLTALHARAVPNGFCTCWYLRFTEIPSFCNNTTRMLNQRTTPENKNVVVLSATTHLVCGQKAQKLKKSDAQTITARCMRRYFMRFLISSIIHVITYGHWCNHLNERCKSPCKRHTCTSNLRLMKPLRGRNVSQLFLSCLCLDVLK